MLVVFKTLVATAIVLALTLVLPSPSNSSGPEFQAAAQSPDPIQLHVTVTGKNDASVSGLQRDNFEVFIDKTPARIVSFDSQDVPAAVGIVFDSSGSMSNNSAEKTRSDFLNLREAVKRFLELRNPSNEYFLMAFNRKPQLLVDWTSDPAILLERFNDFTVYGNSAFYDACYLAVDKLQTSQHAKRVLLLVSDGQDNLSHYTFKELFNLLKRSGVIVYSIFFSPRPTGGSSLAEEGKSILREFSSVSGGILFTNDGYPIKSKEMPGVFERIAVELRQQYSISIVSDQPVRDSDWRKIKVKVKSGVTEKTKTRTRQGVAP